MMKKKLPFLFGVSFSLLSGFDLLNCYSLEFLGDQSLSVLSFNIRHRHIKLSSMDVFEKVSCQKDIETVNRLLQDDNLAEDHITDNRLSEDGRRWNQTETNFTEKRKHIVISGLLWCLQDALSLFSNCDSWRRFVWRLLPEEEESPKSELDLPPNWSDIQSKH